MQNSDFNQQEKIAQSKDSISRFNAQNLQSVNMNNTQTKNNAQQVNAANQQNVSNQNVGIRNQAQQNNNEIGQQNYNNQLKRLGIGNDIRGAQAQNSYNQARDQDAFIGGIASAGAKAYTASQQPKWNPATKTWE